MDTEGSNSESTGEPTNASAARGPSPTLVVRRPDDESQPEVPVMVLRSHSRGGRSSACAPEPTSQAGSQPTGNANLGVQSTRQETSRPEPEIPHDHTSLPTEPNLVGIGLDPPSPETNPTDASPAYTGPHRPKLQVYTGHPPPVYTISEPAGRVKHGEVRGQQ